MSRQTGRYGLNHADIIATLLLDTGLPREVISGRVMLHVDAMSERITELVEQVRALDAQLNYIITGE